MKVRWKPLTEIQKKAKRAEYYLANKDAFATRNRGWYDKNRGAMSEKYKTTARKSKYLYKYGITREDAELMLKGQNNKCAICDSQITFDGSIGGAHTDHDHTTNEVRGILCINCNHGLGSFKDNINNLYSAINYLKKNKYPHLVEPIEEAG
jgi:hypothetical protein